MIGILGRLQQGMETLYRVRTELDVEAFVVDAANRDLALSGCTGPAESRRPREQLLVKETGDGDMMELGLYVNGDTLANLERHDPAHGLSHHNLDDFCLAVEGVSHFVYVAVRAAADRTVSALELELQAEVDKFVHCVLVDETAARHPEELRAHLFEDARLDPDLDTVERDRYERAHEEARRYTKTLERQYLKPRRMTDMLGELRRFYRLGLQDKLGHIARFA